MNIAELQHIFLSDRPAMQENNNNPYRLLHLLRGEMNEFSTAVIDWIVDPNAETTQEMAQESADIALYTQAIISMAGLFLEEEAKDKIAYNMIRFKPKDFRELSYNDAYKKSKQEVVLFQTKKEYYN